MDDMISRQAAITILEKVADLYPYKVPGIRDTYSSYNEAWQDGINMALAEIENMPSAQLDLNEWCMDCKEYDKERYSCPRFNRVIREALKDAKPERKTGKWNFIGDNMFECTSCGVVYTTEQLNGLRNYDTDPYAPKFCPNCGADMRGDDADDIG